jgi:DNA-directed RNA polymerase specialized sigma24 family protein
VHTRAEAFAAFFDEHYEPVQRGLVAALGEPRVAEDAVREAFTRAYVQWNRVSRQGRGAAWLYVAASRAALDRRRSDDPPHAASAERGTPERAIEELAERERLALVLHHHAGFTPPEIARALRCSTETATFTLREAHRRLGIEADAGHDDLPEVQLDEP